LNKGVLDHQFRSQKGRYKRRKVAISPRGDELLISVGGELLVINAKSRAVYKTLAVEEADIQAVSYTEDGKSVYVIAVNPKYLFFDIYVWDRESGRLRSRRRCSGHKRRVTSFSMSPNCKFVVSAGNDLEMKIWQSRDGRELCHFKGHRASISALVYHPLTHGVFSISHDKTLRYWDFNHANDLQSGYRQRFEKSVVQALDKRPEDAKARGVRGQWLFFRGVDEFAIKDLEHARKAGQRVSPLMLARLYWRDSQWQKSEAEFGKLLKLEKLPQGVNRGYLKLCRAAVGEIWRKRQRRLSVDNYYINGLTVHPKEDRVFVVGTGPRRRALVSLIDIQSRRIIRRYYGHQKSVTSLSVSKCGQWMLSGGGDKQAIVWHVETGKVAFKLPEHKSPILKVALFKKEWRAITICADQRVRVWDLNTRTEIRSVKSDKNLIKACAISRGGQVLVTDLRGHMLLWNARDGGPMKRIDGKNRAYLYASFSKDGAEFVTGGVDGKIKVWDAQSGAVLQSYDGHSGGTRLVRWLEDGRFLVSSGYDKRLRIRDRATGRVVKDVGGFDRIVTTAALTRDKSQLLAGDQDGWLWFIELGDLLKRRQK
jgi:WD40 repeat protein